MNEDMILPDDFQADSPQSTETPETNDTATDSIEVEPTSTEQTEPAEPTQAEQDAFLKVKYNKEELALDEERARELAQKGLNYDKVQERLQALESDPRLSFVESLAKQQGMEVEEYLQAVQQYQEEQQLNELIQQNIPEEYAKEMLENRKFRQQLEEERKAKQEEEKKNVEYNEFFDYFNQANGRAFDANTDQIPESVWEANANGIPLRYAYMEHEINQLRTQLSTLKKNEENKQKAPVGGVTTHGTNENASEDPFLKGFNSFTY